ncbi:EAL domain, c-di-GMP-specific phosphodiesterase class I (or its enzymatically inactive variant) [Pseudoxanthomonas sp. CF385]|uniref:sensor domain-containing phosphodiesterase n=1 Tax=Pseudoxanthomonas sp. CF385 TaxID=1881042 RepID=UPI00088B41DF|nr:EAL domain-containing protein [Pseudoxanthomonas sp. CF385]SDQ54198.1 EAL domain, c-di-GMP-specific phosphodiesterase class I (or its enzymatically inactive variant) [Pseudoxanthomonas sp. CF385]
MIDRRIHDELLSDAWLEGGPGAAAIGRNVDRMLDAVRRHLDMDVAFVSEFNGRDRVFRHVVSRLDPAPIRPGDSSPLEEGYCMRVVEGQIPQLIPDTAAVPLLAHIPETALVPIGAHLSVPIQLRDGRVYGTFCCFSLASNLSLSQRDLQMMRAFADLLAYQIDGDLDAVHAHEEKVARVTAVLELGQPHVVYQPVYRSSERRIIGVECLSRFKLEPQRTPDVWFAEAREIGLGVRLELNAILSALDGLRGIPGDFYVALNVSPQTIISGGIDGYIDDLDPHRVVLEITEHSLVDDYGLLNNRLAPLREAGVRIAVDDAGAGYASMRHVLAIHPDIIKLDLSLTRDIDSDSPRRALAAALIEFARQTQSHVVAEGVETASELEALQALGVDDVQGYHLARPLEADALQQKLAAERQRN